MCAIPTAEGTDDMQNLPDISDLHILESREGHIPCLERQAEVRRASKYGELFNH